MTTAWPQLLHDLKAAGLSIRDVAQAAKVKRTTVHRLSVDPAYEPRHDVGNRVIELYRLHCPSSRTD